MKNIVYPLKFSGSKANNLELRFSLRSIEKNLTDDLNVFVVGDEKPDWLTDKVTFIKEEGYLRAMRKMCDEVDEFLWMNDDIYIIDKVPVDYFAKWKRSRIYGKAKIQRLLKSRNGWSRKQGKILQRLSTKGMPTRRYSSHSPYLFNSELLKESLAEFSFGYKTPIETAYGNMYEPPYRASTDKVRMTKEKLIPMEWEGKVLFNHTAGCFTKEVRALLLGMFRHPSSYENQV